MGHNRCLSHLRAIIRAVDAGKSPVAQTLTNVMMPLGNISSGLACRFAMPCS